MSATTIASNILKDVRDAAYEEGYHQGCAYSDEEYNTAYYDGQLDAWNEAPSRFRWWIMGVLGGIAISGIWGILT